MALFAIAFPILPGKTEAWKQFSDELKGAHKSDFDKSRKQLGVHERTFLQHTPMGDLVVVTLEGDDPAGAFMRFGQGTDAFTTWFKEQVLATHGVDLAAPPPGPLPKLLIESSAL